MFYYRHGTCRKLTLIGLPQHFVVLFACCKLHVWVWGNYKKRQQKNTTVIRSYIMCYFFIQRLRKDKLTICQSNWAWRASRWRSSSLCPRESWLILAAIKVYATYQKENIMVGNIKFKVAISFTINLFTKIIC